MNRLTHTHSRKKKSESFGARVFCCMIGCNKWNRREKKTPKPNKIKKQKKHSITKVEMIEHSSCSKQSPFRLAFIVHISPHTLYTINCLFLSFILNYFMNSFSFCKFLLHGWCVGVYVCARARMLLLQTHSERSSSNIEYTRFRLCVSSWVPLCCMQFIWVLLDWNGQHLAYY